MSASTKKKLRKEQNAEQLTEKQLAEQKEAKKLKGYTTVFTVVVVAVICLAVGIMAVTAFNNSGIRQRNTEALVIGEHTLNSAELGYYYIDTVNEYVNAMTEQYGDYASMYMAMMGLDPTKPLNEQSYDNDSTYADYFAELAVSNATSILNIYDQAVAEGHKLTDEEAAQQEASIATMEMYSTMYGYSDVDDYVKVVYGPGTSAETYVEYMNVQTLARSYQSAKFDSLTYDDATISAYDDEHFDEFSSFDYSVFNAYVSDFIQCTADPEDKEHVHSDEEKVAAEKACKEAMEAIVASGATTPQALNDALEAVEAYAEKENVACVENDNRLFSAISDEQTAQWLADESRKPGDIVLLTNESTTTDADGKETNTVYGYYIVLFEGRDDNMTNLLNVRHILKAFTGGTTDPNTGVTTYSPKEKAVAKEAIDKVMEQWRENGSDEEAFKALVSKNSDDTASVPDEGLIEDLYYGKTVENFNDWCFDLARKPGDCEIVETEYGYHMIYFVETQDVLFRDFMIENTLRNTDYDKWFSEVSTANKATAVNTKLLNGDLVLSNT